jgi:hypothetical protein
MATWQDLSRELDAWHGIGATPSLWWRDDDACTTTEALERLIAIAERHHAPLHLAVVPAHATLDLVHRLGTARDTLVMQHGFAHIDHEPEGCGASEVGQTRSLDAQLADLRDGWQRLRAIEMPRLLRAIVPPWNRISAPAVQHLGALGYRMLSAGQVRPARHAAPGLTQVNCHVDPIRWKSGAEFRGTESTLEKPVAHLATRRHGEADPLEPTGLLTHHLDTGETTWGFVEELAARLSHRDAVHWVRLSRAAG